MKRRIVIWTGVGFFVAWAWVLYTFVASPEEILRAMRDPLVQAFGYATCPVVFAAQNFPLRFWWVPPINAATYALIGLAAESCIALIRLREKDSASGSLEVGRL
jgi:cobalamin synthase